MRIFFFSFLILFLSTSLVQAESTKKHPDLSQYLDTSLYYTAKWNGVTIGDAFVDIRPTTLNDYRVETKIRSLGLVKAFSNFESTTQSRVAMNKKGIMTKGSYVHVSQLRDRQRTIKVNFDKNHVKSESMTPEESPGKRPKVASSLKSDVFSPLSAFVAGWERVVRDYQAGKGRLFSPDHFVLPVYDGRRRSDAHIQFTGEKDGLLEVQVRLEPIEGYSANELKSFKQRKYHVKGYIDPNTYLPVRIEGTSKIGNVYITLNKYCLKSEDCRN